ncbi:type I toxin-antitoxin system SymE family toxin [Burkholderia sp. Bp8994]|uniref:SymE family type I addiction module toxin n=1 Tax=Burkholderia sp. Bp8994 TaxID=2184555 RepID=UPI000F5903FF|nr:SymE family type I addiction module toxin [Burkholderia sp. Bp8994]RQR96771.1 type I toxin-antitoxin system SymE family toxin [Burkholderia sp. Bp8994]
MGRLFNICDTRHQLSRRAPRFVKIQESARHHSLTRVLRAIRAHRKLNTTYYPWIKLAGVWLEDAGFEAGERVRITVEHQRLIITPM